ncbi:hypothetical protein AMTR_s00117p00015450 [Amborella trichopoda]|uniref:Uncharacterized protein n=1 Tax=Amborella trichopoda TaxID=13333 RepID=W1NQA7_AMBTC|nr:hypothetical protein AMTR_s00117p00015450 [Amborella trichopoda]
MELKEEWPLQSSLIDPINPNRHGSFSLLSEMGWMEGCSRKIQGSDDEKLRQGLLKAIVERKSLAILMLQSRI